MTPTRTRHGLASLLAASMLVVSPAAIAQAGMLVTDDDREASVSDATSRSDATPTTPDSGDISGLLPGNTNARPIGGHPCETVDATATRRSVTYTCTAHDDASLLWIPDPATVLVGGPCLVRGEQAHAPQPKATTTEPTVLACQMRNDALIWTPASRMCLTAITARNEVASEYIYAREQVAMLSERLREVRGTERLSLNRQIIPLRTSLTTMNGLLTKLAASARTTCGRG